MAAEINSFSTGVRVPRGTPGLCLEILGCYMRGERPAQMTSNARSPVSGEKSATMLKVLNLRRHASTD